MRRSDTARLQRPDVTSWLRTRRQPTKSGGGSCSAESLPPELLLNIFRYLSPRSLLSCSAVCRSWGRAAADDRLWRAVCRRCFPGQREPTGVPLRHAAGWKAAFFTRIRRHSASRKYQQFLAKFADARVFLDFVGDSGRRVELTVSAKVSDVGEFSSVVAFPSAEFPDMRRVQSLVASVSYPIAAPGLLASADCPRRRATLFSLATGCQELQRVSKATREDERLRLHLLDCGLLVAEWRSGGAVAFVRLLLGHRDALLAAARAAAAASATSCDSAAASAASAANSSESIATASSVQWPGESSPGPPAEPEPLLAGLSAACVLKEHRGGKLLHSTWRCVDLRLADGGRRYDCRLVHPRRRSEHQPFDREPQFRWRSAGFSGSLADVCYCDFVLFSGAAASPAVWSASSPVFLRPLPDAADAADSFDYDGPRYSALVANDSGSLELLVVKDAIGGQGYLVGLLLSVCADRLLLQLP